MDKAAILKIDTQLCHETPKKEQWKSKKGNGRKDKNVLHAFIQFGEIVVFVFAFIAKSKFFHPVMHFTD